MPLSIPPARCYREVVVFSLGLGLIKAVVTIKAYSQWCWLRTTERTFLRQAP